MTTLTHVTPTTECPCCGTEVDRATNVRGRGGPQAGDIFICVQCGAINSFTASGGLAVVPAALVARPNMREARATRDVIRRMRGFKIL